MWFVHKNAGAGVVLLGVDVVVRGIALLCQSFPDLTVRRTVRLVMGLLRQVAILNNCKALHAKFLALLVDHARRLHRLEIYGEV